MRKRKKVANTGLQLIAGATGAHCDGNLGNAHSTPSVFHLRGYGHDVTTRRFESISLEFPGCPWGRSPGFGALEQWVL